MGGFEDSSSATPFWSRGERRRMTGQGVVPAMRRTRRPFSTTCYHASSRSWRRSVDVSEEGDLEGWQIWNVDETRMNQQNVPIYVIAMRGCVHVHIATQERCSHTTLVAAVHAGGGMMAPFFVVTGKRMSATFAEADGSPGSDFGDELPSGSAIACTESGYVTDELWTKKVVGHIIKEMRAVATTKGFPDHWMLMVMDGYGSHTMTPDALSAFRDAKIICICMPAHTSADFEPLDVSVFRLFKALNNALHAWQRQHGKGNMTRQELIGLACHAIDKSHTETVIKHGFERTGIFPHMSAAEFTPSKQPAAGPRNVSISTTFADMTKQSGDEKAEHLRHLTEAFDVEMRRRRAQFS